MVKKSKLAIVMFGVFVASCLSGCIGEDLTEESVPEGQYDSARYNPDSPATQSIVITNALDPVVLVPNDLALYPLSFSEQPITSVTQLQAPSGANLRRLLQYIVGCALPRNQSFDFDWTDLAGANHNERFRGDAGLAPNWKNAAMTVKEQEWVSACLASRSNWYGVPVRISMRGSLSELDVSAGERNVYDRREGAYWGNIFSDTPFLNACFDPTNADYARSQQRDCAAGHEQSGIISECGMISIVGPCQQACSTVSPDGYYSNCSVNQYGSLVGPPTNRVITVFLR